MCKIIKVVYSWNKRYGVRMTKCPYGINRERSDQTNSSTKKMNCARLQVLASQNFEIVNLTSWNGKCRW